MNGDIEVARLDLPGGALTLSAPAGMTTEPGTRMLRRILAGAAIIELDPDDLRDVFGDFRTGWVVSGQNCESASDAARSALDSLEHAGMDLKNFRRVLVAISVPASSLNEDMSDALLLVDAAANAISNACDPDACIYFGATINDGLRVALIVPSIPSTSPPATT